MATMAVITIIQSGNTQGETRQAETLYLVDCLERLAIALVGSHAPSITVKDRNGFAACSCVYTPIASG
jgi:hypothetical protein